MNIYWTIANIIITLLIVIVGVVTYNSIKYAYSELPACKASEIVQQTEYEKWRLERLTEEQQRLADEIECETDFTKCKATNE